MPIYEAECTVCRAPFEWYSSQVTDETRDCPSCGGKAERLFSRYSAKVFQEFVTRNIDPSGVPIRIKSQSQLSSLCNEHKLIHMDDPKYQPKHPTPQTPEQVLGVRNPTPDGQRGVDGGACRREDIA